MCKGTVTVDGNSGLLQRRAKALRRFCKRLQRELECPPVNPDRLPGAKVLKDLHHLFRFAMRFAHEFVRFIGPDGDGGEVRRAKALPRLSEIGTVAGVAGDMKLIAILESEHEPGPQRLFPVERRRYAQCRTGVAVMVVPSRSVFCQQSISVTSVNPARRR